jgi:hypothetical protein
MARQGKALQARRTRPALDDSLLLRSAESLGRMIGSLQRQLDGASKKLSAGTEGVAAAFGMNGSGDGTQPGRPGKSAGKSTAKRTPKKTAAKAVGSKTASQGSRKSGAANVRTEADKKSKRVSKSAAARKPAGRSGSGGARKSSKTSRAS